MEEIKKILKMVEEGKINADDGYRLIEAVLDDVFKKGKKVKMFKIYVKDEEGDEVNLKIPVSLLKFGLKFIPRDKIEDLKEKDIDLEEILSSINIDSEGEILNVKTEDGDVVKIWIE
ncbi:MAG: hypothetical protein ABIM58_02315 [candidate division WOR-3 bacterium]